MPPLQRSTRFVLYHVLAWLGFAGYEQSVFLVIGTNQMEIWHNLPYYLLNAGLFYGNASWLLPKLVARQRYLLYCLGALLLLLLYALLRTELYLYLLAVDPALPDASSYSQTLALSSYRGIFFFLVSIGYWFSRHALQLEKQKRVQEQQLRDTERSLMEANLAYLKSQINPHFLFNALNFLYAQVYPHSESAARGILLLSDTMRYALQDDEHNGKVMLTQEIQHLHNYIAINQLRFNNRLQIRFEVSGNTQFLMILPLVLITFVENCFKHGELDDPAHPLQIELAVVQNHLTFRTHNRKRHGPKAQTTGIGLVNTQKRLELLYPGRYALTTQDEPDFYQCTLTLDL